MTESRSFFHAFALCEAGCELSRLPPLFKIPSQNTADNFPATMEFHTSGEVGLTQSIFRSDIANEVEAAELRADEPRAPSAR